MVEIAPRRWEFQALIFEANGVGDTILKGGEGTMFQEEGERYG
jgi:hypothetical protein